MGNALLRVATSRRTPALAGVQDIIQGESFGKSLDLSTSGGWLNLLSMLAEPISSTQVREMILSPQLSGMEKWAAVLASLAGKNPQLREALPDSSLSDVDWVKKYAGMHGLSSSAQYKKLMALVNEGDDEGAQDYAASLREAWLDARPVGRAEQAKRDDR